MVATCQEVMEQENHEARLRDDPAYAVENRAALVYGDLREFEQFLDDFQIVPLISRELLRAVCNIGRGGVHSANAVNEAVFRIKAEIDAKIVHAVENGK